MAKKSNYKASAKSKPAAFKAPKLTAASKPRSRGEFYTTIAEQTQLSRKQVASVFETMGKILSMDLGKSGPGICNVAGLMKVTVVRKPATKARKGINPFTGEETVFKARPASKTAKVTALKKLKDGVAAKRR